MLKAYVGSVERNRKDDWIVDYVFCSSAENALFYAEEETAKFDCGLFVRNGGVRVQSEDGALYTIHEFQTELFKDGWVIYCLVPFRPADEAPGTKR